MVSLSHASGRHQPLIAFVAQECYCSNTLASSSVKVADQTSCNMICKGDRLEYCGGSKLLNLYKSSPSSRFKRAMIAAF